MSAESIDHSSDSTSDDGGATGARGGVGMQTVGARVRTERLRQNIGVRELARRVGVSASLISQVELGKASPSVGTLYAIVNELGLSLDELFFDESGPSRRRPVSNGDHPAAAASGAPGPAPPAIDHDGAVPAPAPPQGAPVEPVVRRNAGKGIQLAWGVRWDRLTPETPQDVDFLRVTYEAGADSCPADSLMRHSGKEYGHVLSGRLGVTIGFDTYELGPGDSVSFESSMPHRLFAIGDEPVDAIWFVVGRRGDPRIVRGDER
jgi:quercetin dioxygenase-like cupin family protein/DNA-binding XRE family transcriptional regulator